MPVDYAPLNSLSRLLLEAHLRPLQGHRFQPTGFPDLGAARYTLHDGTEMLLLESAQSVANRMELACWDMATNDLISELKGLPYVVVQREDGSILTTSVLEAHRLNSPYILESEDKTVYNRLKDELAGLEIGPVDLQRLASLVFKYDVNALLHGLFIAKDTLAGGRLRLTRMLSGFIEAHNVSVAESGGVKVDRVDPSGDTGRGFGHVPFHRTEFTAERITAYFNLDLALLRGYHLGVRAEQLLISLALFKVRRFLSAGLRLRTACDLALDGDVRVTSPTDSFCVPSEQNLLEACRSGIDACRSLFAQPPVTVVQWKGKTRKNKNAPEANDNGGEDGEEES